MDKAISVGEKSKFIANEILISNSNIGIAIKDLSSFKGDKIMVNETPTCIQLFQKIKFGGLLLN